jgi:hypothetical protein
MSEVPGVGIAGLGAETQLEAACFHRMTEDISRMKIDRFRVLALDEQDLIAIWERLDPCDACRRLYQEVSQCRRGGASIKFSISLEHLLRNDHIGILDSFGVAYEREWRLEPSFLALDFYLTDLRKGIEFHGRIHGQLNQERREANDAKKRELLDCAGIETLWISHTEMDDIAALTDKIRAFCACESQEPAPTRSERDLPF